jgi:HlyD family secretion protein
MASAAAAVKHWVMPTANVTVVFADLKDVPLIPNAALRFPASDELLSRSGKLPTPSVEKRLVWKQKGEQAIPLVIKIGVTDETSTELLGGALQEGDALVTEIIGGNKSGPGRFGRVF